MLKKYNNTLNLDTTIAKDLFNEFDHPWEVLVNLKEYIISKGKNLDKNFKEVKDNVWIHKDAIIYDSAYINGPTIICKNAEIKHCAYIRGNAIIGENTIIGNSTEVKNAIIFNNCKCPHFNYIGDAILGENVHTGAGVILSNVKSDKSMIIIKDKNESYNTNLKKMSAIIGNNVEVGCNSVICPGSIIYENTTIYPLSLIRGIIGKNKIVKSSNNIINKE